MGVQVFYDGRDERAVINRDGMHFALQFQHGTVPDEGVNGLFNEDVIQALILRLRDLNVKLSCRENSLAITKLEEALLWLNHRTDLRVAQGVEGKVDAPHREVE